MITVNQTNNTILVGATSYSVNELQISGAVQPGGNGSFMVTARKQGNSFPNINQLVNELAIDSSAINITAGNVQNTYTVGSAELSPTGDLIQFNLYRQAAQQNIRGK